MARQLFDPSQDEDIRLSSSANGKMPWWSGNYVLTWAGFLCSALLVLSLCCGLIWFLASMLSWRVSFGS